MSNGDLGVIVGAVRSLKYNIKTAKRSTIIVEARRGQTLYSKS